MRRDFCGQLRAQYQAAKARWEEARAAYEQSILTAFQEVSDALIAREKLGDARAHHQQESLALASSVDLVTQRYAGGRSS
jgi:outer membrane protein TolC